MTLQKVKPATIGQKVAGFENQSNFDDVSLTQTLKKRQPFDQEKLCAVCGKPMRMVWGWLLCWKPLQMIPLCLSCICRLQASAAAEREAEAARLLACPEREGRAAA